MNGERVLVWIDGISNNLLHEWMVAQDGPSPAGCTSAGKMLQHVMIISGGNGCYHWQTNGPLM